MYLYLYLYIWYMISDIWCWFDIVEYGLILLNLDECQDILIAWAAPHARFGRETLLLYIVMSSIWPVVFYFLHLTLPRRIDIFIRTINLFPWWRNHLDEWLKWHRGWHCSSCNCEMVRLVACLELHLVRLFCRKIVARIFGTLFFGGCHTGGYKTVLGLL